MTGVSVLARVDDVRSFISTYHVLTSALGSSFSMVLPVPEFLSHEIRSLAQHFELDVAVVPDATPETYLPLLNNDEPVLLLPKCSPITISGIQSATQLLAATPGALSVSGVVWDRHGRASTNGFVPQYISHEKPPLLVGIEKSDEPWRRFGPFAYATVMAPTPFSIVRANHVTTEMCLDISAFGQAVTQWSLATDPSKSRALLFSGLNLIVHDSEASPPISTGEIEGLPESVFDAWVQRGLEEVRALHTGFAVRDDQRRRVLCVPDPMVRAVDGKAIVTPAHPSSTLLGPSYLRQLGPGFEQAMTIAQRQAAGLSNSRTHWGSYEDRVVSLAKRVDALLPHRLREWARRLLRG